MTDTHIDELNAKFENCSVVEIIWWAIAQFEGRIVATSSFQTQSVPLLHLFARICPKLPVVFLETGYHFPQTLDFRDKLVREFGLNVENVAALVGRKDEEISSSDLWKKDPRTCCYLNKVEPLERAMENRDAWIAGVRRDQTIQRRTTPIVSRDRKGKIKICPFVRWKSETINAYVKLHSLPEHPLSSRGYPSIGCAPCTKPVSDGQNIRDGRWAESDKTECGLHFDESGKRIPSNTQKQ